MFRDESVRARAKGDGTSGDLAMLNRTFNALEARQVIPNPQPCIINSWSLIPIRVEGLS